MWEERVNATATRQARVLLETAMRLLGLFGYLALAPLIGRPPSRQAYARGAGAGVCLALPC